MSEGVNSLFAPWIGGGGTDSTVNAIGARSMFAFWVGGAANAGIPPSAGIGPRSIFASWMGGAGTTAAPVGTGAKSGVNRMALVLAQLADYEESHKAVAKTEERKEQTVPTSRQIKRVLKKKKIRIPDEPEEYTPTFKPIVERFKIDPMVSKVLSDAMAFVDSVQQKMKQEQNDDEENLELLLLF